MEFLRRAVDRIFKLSPQDQASLDALKARHRQEEEALTIEAIYSFYVLAERMASDSVSINRKTSNEYPTVDSLVKNRLVFESGTSISSATDQLESGEPGLMQLIDPNKRQQVKTEALKRAKRFWEEELTKPDLTTDQVMLGRRRITHLTSRLEQLGIDSNSS